MRYDADHKQASRRRIVRTAGERFRRDGFASSGVAALMADAGLTNGAFYAHFSSKDELVATVVADSLREQSRLFEDPAGAPLPVAVVIDLYLSEEHRDDPAHGCPSAAFIDEVARASTRVQAAYADGLDGVLGVLARSIRATSSHLDADDAVALAQDLLAYMLGALQLARAVADEERSGRILQQSRLRAMDIAASALPGTDSPHPSRGQRAATTLGGEDLRSELRSGVREDER